MVDSFLVVCGSFDFLQYWSYSFSDNRYGAYISMFLVRITAITFFSPKQECESAFPTRDLCLFRFAGAVWCT